MHRVSSSWSPASQRQPICLLPLLWKMSHCSVGRFVLVLINGILCPSVLLPCSGVTGSRCALLHGGAAAGSCQTLTRGGEQPCLSCGLCNRHSGIVHLSLKVSFPF